MAIGKRSKERQEPLWVETRELPKPSEHPFYVSLNKALDEAAFDQHVEDQCRRFCSNGVGRPGLAPGV